MEWKFPAKLDSNYDGDTFKLELDIGFGLRNFISARLDGVDTPELRGGTDLTKAAAKLARDEANRFISEADEVLFHCTVWGGKYGRPVGRIICDGVDLSQWLIDNNLGLPYDGGSRNLDDHIANAELLRKQGKI